jgi:3-hydroxyisobutyrate dehydrogenase-like beta-hydroxyacid dehydrogenase
MARRPRKNVGVIGLGIIGSRVADNLRAKGYHVFVWNRSPRPVPNFVGAPAELADMCEHIQIFVSDDDALLEVVKQLSPGLAPRHVIMAHSTVAPQSMLAAAEIVERRGARFIEAPFTGSKLGAEKGELVYYVAGDEVALREARPILEASSKEVLEIGAVGQATVIKIATNILTGAIVQGAAEALALTKSSGVPLEKFTAAMQSNASNSGTLAMKLPKMIEGNFEPHFSVKHMLKDLQIASRVGLMNHLELSVTAATRDRLLEQAQRGFADEDYAALARKYFHDAGPAPEDETNLELFNQAEPFAQVEVPAAMGSVLDPETSVATADAAVEQTSSSPAAMSQNSPPEAAGAIIEPAAKDIQSAQADTSAGPVNETGAAEPAAERRGLFDRILGRGSEA